MTALLSLTLDLVASTFYQKREQPETAEPVKRAYFRRTLLRQNLFSYQRANGLNYREAVSFILPIPNLIHKHGKRKV